MTAAPASMLQHISPAPSSPGQKGAPEHGFLQSDARAKQGQTPPARPSKAGTLITQITLESRMHSEGEGGSGFQAASELPSSGCLEVLKASIDLERSQFPCPPSQLWSAEIGRGHPARSWHGWWFSCSRRGKSGRAEGALLDSPCSASPAGSGMAEKGSSTQDILTLLGEQNKQYAEVWEAWKDAKSDMDKAFACEQLTAINRLREMLTQQLPGRVDMIRYGRGCIWRACGASSSLVWPHASTPRAPQAPCMLSGCAPTHQRIDMHISTLPLFEMVEAWGSVVQSK